MHVHRLIVVSAGLAAASCAPSDAEDASMTSRSPVVATAPNVDLEAGYWMCRIWDGNAYDASTLDREAIDLHFEDVTDPYVAMADADLAALVSEGGALDARNITMRNVAHYLACRYRATGDSTFARKARVLLRRFAEVVAQWPIVRIGYADPYDPCGTGLAQLPAWNCWSNGGLWGAWYYDDFRAGHPLLFTKHLIEGAVGLGADVDALVDRLVTATMPQYQGADHNNLSGYRIRDLIPYGVFHDPMYTHRAIDWMRDSSVIGFYRDGAWSEGAPGYHAQISNQLLHVPIWLEGYSDPPGWTAPDGTRFDALTQEDVAGDALAQHARMRVAQDLQTLPNGRFLGVHDQRVHQTNWGYSLRPTSQRTDPFHLFGLRQATARRVAPTGEQVQMILHYGDTVGHEHLDNLNLILWANEHEAISDGGDARYATRAWMQATAAHNTVVVDETNQSPRFAPAGDVVPLDPLDDAIDTIGTTAFIQSMARVPHFGNLRLWSVDHLPVQIVEADAAQSYPTGVLQRYQRTLALVQIDGLRSYVVDVFRVQGGSTHDWMLHGTLDIGEIADVNVSLSPAAENRHGYMHLIEKGITNDTFWIDFGSHESGRTLRSTVVGSPGTEVSVGMAPAMRRPGDGMFVDVRRTGGDNVFIAVHDPHAGELGVTNVELLSGGESADAPIMLAIHLADGRVDYIGASADPACSSALEIPGSDTSVRAAFFHLRGNAASPESLLAVDADALTVAGSRVVTQSTSHHGAVSGVERTVNGDGYNAFLTLESIPTDGRLDGQTLLVSLGDGRVEGYRIEEVRARQEGARIVVDGDPGLELREGDLGKLTYFPWLGVRGDVTFTIPGRALVVGSTPIATTALR